MIKRITLLIAFLQISCMLAFSQTVPVSGTIKDKLNNPLPGVSVKVKNSSAATSTNTDGKYAIAAKTGDVLVFTSIGFVTQEQTVSSGTLNVVLADENKDLSEVVVVGYGTQRRKDLTGAIASISAKSVENVPITRLDQMIQGRASGVQVTQTQSQPGGSVSLRIRGTNSINSSNEPLFVIDGFPGAGNLSSINPADIQSIDILKDPSSIAIYGSRGANGVVIVTTKKGTAGQSSINFEAYHGIQQVRNPYKMMDATEFANYLNDAQRLNNIETPASAKALPYTDTQIAALGKGTDWQDELFRTAPISNYQLNFLGGTQDTRYNLSMNYFDQEGIVINSGYKKGSIRFNLDKKVGEKLNFGFTSQLTGAVDNRALVNTAGGSAGGVLLDALRINPALPVYNPDGSYTYQNGPTGYAFALGNPVAYANETQNRYKNLRGLVNFFGEYEITKGLKFKSTFGTDFNIETRDFYLPSDVFLGSNTVGSARKENTNSLSWVNENTLTYDKKLNDNNAINVIGGFSTQEFDTDNFFAANTNFFTNLLGSDNIGTGASVLTPGSGRTKNTLSSFFGRVNYRLMDKYLVTFTMRADGSSKFGEDSKWGYFPSAAVAWRVIDEDFMKSVTFVSDLKVRGSYGVSGNQEIDPYQSLARYAINGATIGDVRVVGISPNNIPNPDLAWESTSSFDIGLDVGLFKNRITLTADYYSKHTKNLLLDVSVPRTTGFASTVINAGGVDNKGYELAINTQNITAKLFQWTTNLNFSVNRNKVTDLAGEKERFVGDASGSLFPSGTGGTNILRVGEPIGSFYGYRFAGIWQTQSEIDASGIKGVLPGDPRYADLNNDKIIDAKDREIIGRAQPDFTYGVTNNFTYGRLNLNIFIQGVQGDDVLNLNRYELESGDYTTNKLESVVNRWTGPNTSNTIPKANSTLRRRTGITSDVVENGSYLRLKTISLAYNIPIGKALGKTIKSASIYVTGTNLLTSTKYTGYDPEVNSFGSNTLSMNTDYNAYPTTKTYTAGIRLGF